MTNETRAMVGLIADGLDPAIVERVLRRAGHLCELQHQEQTRRLTGESCDKNWVSGYAGGWRDCADLLRTLANGMTAEAC